MRKYIKYFAILSLIVIVASCVNDFESVKNSQTNYTPESAKENFDFNSEGQINVTLLNVGEKTHVTIMDAETNESLFSAFSKGKDFSTTFAIPSHVSKLYIETSLFDHATVNVESSISVDFLNKQNETRATTPVSNNLIWKSLGTMQNKDFYTCIEWDNKGKITDGILYYQELDMTPINTVLYTLWGNNVTKPTGLDNRGNLNFAKKATTVLGEDAELFMTYITENAWNRNVIGYSYKVLGTNEERFVVTIPNAASGYGKPADNVIQRGTTIQMLYEGQTIFPKGIEVNYFCIADGWKDNGINYTIALTRSENKDFVAFQTEGMLIYGVEDKPSADHSYEDVLFTIQATPYSAIKDDDRPTIDEDKLIFTNTTFGKYTYLFEDLWPNDGDADLNDVIVEHTKDVFYTSSGSYVFKIEDTYKLVQPDGSATQANAFMVQYNYGEPNNVDAANYEKETDSWLVFADCRDKSKVIKHIRTFALSDKVTANDIKTKDVVVPYLIPNFVELGIARNEVHFAHEGRTSLGEASEIGNADHYIRTDGIHPFALKLPTQDYIPSAEGQNIESIYPDYTEWVKSGGTKGQGWYKNKQ